MSESYEMMERNHCSFVGGHFHSIKRKSPLGKHTVHLFSPKFDSPMCFSRGEPLVHENQEKVYSLVKKLCEKEGYYLTKQRVDTYYYQTKFKIYKPKKFRKDVFMKVYVSRIGLPSGLPIEFKISHWKAKDVLKKDGLVDKLFDELDVLKE